MTMDRDAAWDLFRDELDDAISAAMDRYSERVSEPKEIVTNWALVASSLAPDTKRGHATYATAGRPGTVPHETIGLLQVGLDLERGDR